MLMTPITPKVMARPMAASSSTEPSEMPYQRFCATSQTASVLRNRVDAGLDHRLQLVGRTGEGVDQHGLRGAVAVADDGGHGSALFFGRRVGLEHDDGVGQFHRVLDLRVGFGRERLVEEVQHRRDRRS